MKPIVIASEEETKKELLNPTQLAKTVLLSMSLEVIVKQSVLSRLSALVKNTKD